MNCVSHRTVFLDITLTVHLSDRLTLCLWTVSRTGQYFWTSHSLCTCVSHRTVFLDITLTGTYLTGSRYAMNCLAPEQYFWNTLTVHLSAGFTLRPVNWSAPDSISGHHTTHWQPIWQFHSMPMNCVSHRTVFWTSHSLWPPNLTGSLYAYELCLAPDSIFSDITTHCAPIWQVHSMPMNCVSHRTVFLDITLTVHLSDRFTLCLWTVSRTGQYFWTSHSLCTYLTVSLYAYELCLAPDSISGHHTHCATIWQVHSMPMNCVSHRTVFLDITLTVQLSDRFTLCLWTVCLAPDSISGHHRGADASVGSRMCLRHKLCVNNAWGTSEQGGKGCFFGGWP